MALPGQESALGYGELVRQYLELRDQHPGIILLFRVGSFYEVLFEDAELVARELGLKLSERPSGGSAPPVAQCGFAHHALDNFLPRLLQRGYRVAVCEETDEEAGSGPRQRAVVRTLTPGTVTDTRLLAEDKPTYLATIAVDHERLGMAWTDVAAGEFKAGEFNFEEAAAELQRLAPAEILVPADRPVPPALMGDRAVTPVASSAGVEGLLRRTFPGATLDDLPLAQVAAGLVVRYLAETQGTDTMPLEAPQQAGANGDMRLDAATQRHLEIVETERGRERRGSLLAAVDRTITPMGRRMLRSWLLRPATNLARIATRQRLIGELIENVELRTGLARYLDTTTDLERLAGRAAAGKATPDDLRALATVTQGLPELARTVESAHSPFLKALGKPRARLAEFAEIALQVLGAEGSDQLVRPEASPLLADALREAA